jgi:hypothetical protein
MCGEVSMPQLHLYVPEPIAAAIKRQADASGLSVSGYLGQIVTRQVQEGWPTRFFEEVVGGWQGEPLVRHPQGRYEERERL